MDAGKETAIRKPHQLFAAVDRARSMRFWEPNINHCHYGGYVLMMQPETQGRRTHEKMKSDIATLADVQNAVNAFVAAAEVDTTLEQRSGKKLAAAVAALLLNDTKDIKQAFTNGEKWWAVNAYKRKDGCTPENRNQKIEEYIRRSDAWSRFNSNELNRARAEQWLADKLESETNNEA